MLRLEIRSSDGFDEVKGEFVNSVLATLELEHSLVSLSKWESKYKIPFLSDKKLTEEQTQDYIVMMSISGEFPESLFASFTAENYDQIRLYIDEKMTATTIPEQIGTPSKEIVTAELIYYWMIALTIPFECQYWHLDRLLTLIRVCNLKNSPKDQKKRATTSDAIAQRRALNEKRRQEMGSQG